MPDANDTSYTDAKGRTRWHHNDEVGGMLKELGDFLIISGYDESHAARYPRLAHAVSRYPESVVQLAQENRLGAIPGIGGTITSFIAEYLETGTCSKIEETAEHTPRTVLELTAIPRLGAKTVRSLYQEHGIDSLAALAEALDDGRLEGIKGLGKKTLETMRDFVAGHEAGR